MDQKNIFIILLIFRTFSQYTSIVSPFFKSCYRDDSNFNECIKRSVEALKPFLRKGIPEFHIPPCEPLEIPQIIFDQMTNPAFVASTYTKINIKGGTHFIIKYINVDMKNNNIQMKLFIPRLLMTANYNMDGKILMVPIKGKGKTDGNFSEINVDVNIHAIQYQNSNTNQTHFRIINSTFIIDIGHGQIHLNNLFNGDKKLSDAMNKFLNENWKIIATELKPVLEMKINKIFTKFANEFFTKYSLDLLFPSSEFTKRHD